MYTLTSMYSHRPHLFPRRPPLLPNLPLARPSLPRPPRRHPKILHHSHNPHHHHPHRPLLLLHPPLRPHHLPPHNVHSRLPPPQSPELLPLKIRRLRKRRHIVSFHGRCHTHVFRRGERSGYKGREYFGGCVASSYRNACGEGIGAGVGDEESIGGELDL